MESGMYVETGIRWQYGFKDIDECTLTNRKKIFYVKN